MEKLKDKEYWETKQARDAAIYNRRSHKANEAFQEAMNESLLQQAENNIKIGDLALNSHREAARPHNMYDTEVYYDPSELKYVCRLPAPDAEEEGLGEAICAYGDTPSEACDNFDHQWVYRND